jgi:hypothetical protein
MLFDPHGDLGDVQLLDDAGRGLDRLEIVPAGGTAVEVIIGESAVDLLGCKCEALMFGVPGLSADLASVLSRWRWRLGGLDDVRGGGLGGGGGILASGGQLLLQSVDGGLEDVELGLLGVESRSLSVELRLQPLTVRTRRYDLGVHGGRFYRLRIGDTTP